MKELCWMLKVVSCHFVIKQSSPQFQSADNSKVDKVKDWQSILIPRSCPLQSQHVCRAGIQHSYAGVQKAIYSFQMCLMQHLLNRFVEQYKSAFPMLWNNCRDEEEWLSITARVQRIVGCFFSSWVSLKDLQFCKFWKVVNSGVGGRFL